MTDEPAREVLSTRAVRGARFFPGARLNYAEHALSGWDELPAVVYRPEGDRRVELSRRQLREGVAAARTGLRRLGVRTGDRVAAFVANDPRAVIAMLATAILAPIAASFIQMAISRTREYKADRSAARLIGDGHAAKEDRKNQ